jgi:hypothetical protein
VPFLFQAISAIGQRFQSDTETNRRIVGRQKSHKGSIETASRKARQLIVTDKLSED